MSLRRILFSVLAVIALLLPPTSAGAQSAGTRQRSDGLVVEASRQVTTDPNPVRLYVTPALAVQPNEPSTVVMSVTDARNGGCGLAVSRDGGLSWQRTAQTLLPSDQPFCVQNNFGPVMGLAFARNGTLYAAMSGSSVETGHPRGPITALAARTSDLGRTREAVTVAESKPYTYEPENAPPQEGFEQHRLVNIAVDPRNPDKVYMGWRQGVGGITAPPGTQLPINSLIAVSDDGGKTWGEPFRMMDALDEEVAGSDTAMLAVGPDGTAYAFTKERPQIPQEGPRPPSRLFMSKSTDGGKTWTTKVISKGAPFIDTPAVAVDQRSGNLYLTYASRGRAQEDPSQAFFMASTDGGKTWTEPVNIGDPDQGASFNKYFPGINVAPNGRIDIAWYDFRDDPFFTPGGVGAMGTTEGERYWDVYYAYSTDSGKTWSRNLRVTDRSVDGNVGVTFNNQDVRGPLGVASTSDAAYLAWSDSRAGSSDFDAEDAYFTRVRFPSSAVALAGAPVSGQSKVLWSLVGAGVALALGGLVLALGTRMARSGAPAAKQAERAPVGTAE